MALTVVRQCMKTVILAILLMSLQQPVSAQTVQSPRSNSEIKAKLREVLSQPEFTDQSARPGHLQQRIESYADRIKAAWRNVSKWLEGWWARLRRLFEVARPATRSIGLYIVASFIGLCIAAAGFLLYRYAQRIRSAQRELAGAQRATPFVLGDEMEEAMSRSADEWLRDAETLASSGSFRRSIRARFLALLVKLDQAGLLEYKKYSTNGDYALDLMSHCSKPIAQEFDRLVGQYEYVWYGEHDTDRDADLASALQFKSIVDGLEGMKPCTITRAEA